MRILVSASFCGEHLNIRFKSSSCACLGFANKSKNCACARVSPYPGFLCSTANVVYPGYAHDGKEAGVLELSTETRRRPKGTTERD